jgi:hypothetical protein
LYLAQVTRALPPHRNCVMGVTARHLVVSHVDHKTIGKVVSDGVQ